MFWRKRVRVEHTGDGVTRRPTVLKTVAVTGLHALPQLTIHTLAAPALGQVLRGRSRPRNRRLQPLLFAMLFDGCNRLRKNSICPDEATTGAKARTQSCRLTRP